MIRLNIHQAKTHLSRYLEKVERGETIVLCRRNVPIAEIRALPRPAKKRRPIGLGKGLVRVLPSFFEPLPDEMIEGFEGKR